MDLSAGQTGDQTGRPPARPPGRPALPPAAGQIGHRAGYRAGCPSGHPPVPVRLPLLAGLLALAAVLAGSGLWAARVPIEGAVVAAGRLEPADMRQAVQHPEGGTVTELRVREGSRVAAGAVLLRLDSSAPQGELDRTEAQLCELTARSLRLLAERDHRPMAGEAAPSPPSALPLALQPLAPRPPAPGSSGPAPPEPAWPGLASSAPPSSAPLWPASLPPAFLPPVFPRSAPLPFAATPFVPLSLAPPPTAPIPRDPSLTPAPPSSTPPAPLSSAPSPPGPQQAGPVPPAPALRADAGRSASGDGTAAAPSGADARRADLSDSAAPAAASPPAEEPGRGLAAPAPPLSGGADCADRIAAERELFQARAEALAGAEARLRREEAALTARARGLAQQEAALAEQAGLAAAEIARQEQLLARHLAAGDRLGQLRMTAAELAARRAALAAERAEAERQAAEAGFARGQLGLTRREEAATLLRDLDFAAIELQARAAELRRRIAAATLRAPVDGTVWGLGVHGPGAVLPAAAPALYVVPQGTPPLVVAHVPALARDLLHPGQSARLRLPGIDGGRSPELAAAVAGVSADIFPIGSDSPAADGPRGLGVYRLELRLEPGEAARLGEGHRLQPGMPVEVFLTTGARTPLQWLVAPLTAFFHAALREG